MMVLTSSNSPRRRPRPNLESPKSDSAVQLDPPLWHTAKPQFAFNSRLSVLTLFLLIDFLIYLERGIVPGAHEELTHFLVQYDFIRKHPEVYFGLLQSVFIGGLAVTAPILSYFAAKTNKPVPFLAVGLGLWLVSILGCFVAGAIHSVELLFISRTCSGVGEGAFIGLMAPVLLDCNTDAQRGTFLGLFYGLMPAGMALGFISSAMLASMTTTWYPAFAGLFLVASVPILIVIVFASTPASHGVSPFRHLAESVSTADSTTARSSSVNASLDVASDQSSPKQHSSVAPSTAIGEQLEPLESCPAEALTFSLCLRNLLWSPLFLMLLMSGAAQAAVSASLISFGSAFLLALGVFPSEVAASSVIGIVGAATGALGTFAGGLLTDLPLRKLHTMDTSAREIEFVGPTIIGTPTQITTMSSLKRKLAWAGEDLMAQTRRIFSIRLLTPLLSGLALAAACLLSVTPIMMDFGASNASALSTMTVGLLCLFMTQGGLNFCVMSCAPTAYRSMAISVYTLGLHLIGDVPGPIIVGYMKDHWAPGCSQPILNGIVPLQCQTQRTNLLMTLFVFLSWGHCIWLGMFLAFKTAKLATKTPSLPSHFYV